MSSFIVTGNFVATGGIPANTLSGTIDITAGQITALDLAVPGFASHFTEIYFNQFFNSAWLVSAYNANDNYASPHGEDYININFMPVPGPYLIGFQQARIINGYVDTYHYDPITTVGTITYYGLALGGTICPPVGCAPFPPPVVPGPVAGEGLIGLALALCVLFRLKK